jgi:hypothetical protein
MPKTPAFRRYDLTWDRGQSVGAIFTRLDEETVKRILNYDVEIKSSEEYKGGKINDEKGT